MFGIIGFEESAVNSQISPASAADFWLGESAIRATEIAVKRRWYF